MKIEIKSGVEIIDEFFIKIKSLPEIDQKIVEKLFNLHKAVMLTNANITNALLDLRNDGNQD